MGTSPLPCTPNIHPRSNSPSLPACCLPASTPSLVGSPHCSSFRIAKTDGWPWLRGAASKKLNENKMANRCAMRQRPSPNEKCQSQPRPHALTPCEIIRVLLLLAPPVAVAASATSPGAACAVAAEPGILSFGPMPICPSHILIHTPPPPARCPHIQRPACLSAYYCMGARRVTIAPSSPKLQDPREEPAARLLLNAAASWLLALSDDFNETAQRSTSCVIKPRYGVPTSIFPESTAMKLTQHHGFPLAHAQSFPPAFFNWWWGWELYHTLPDW